nr:MAG TPA: hypothetical protein [Caudoviricetes sp.]
MIRSGNVAYHVASVVKNRKRLYINVYESLQPNYKNRVNLATKKAGFPQLINKSDKFIIPQGELKIWRFLM